MKARLPQGMGGGAQNMNQIIKQAQKMQDEMKELQDKLDITEYQGESGGGLVKVTVTGKHDAVAVKIDPSAIDVDDIEMLEDLVAAALNDGISKARADGEVQMEGITGGMNLPGMM
ncbi:MAG: YbaB/EbfC family nucleoid-associated protein [Oscillospiraceae bacterium]